MQFHTALLNFMCDMTLVSQTVTAHRVTTCLENLEISGNLTAVREMSGIFAKSQGIVREKILSGKSCLKLFIVNCNLCPYRYLVGVCCVLNVKFMVSDHELLHSYPHN